MNKKNGIIIFGEMGSGKDEFALQISKLNNNSEIFNIGDLCRDIMRVAKVNVKWKNKQRELGQLIADKLREIDDNIMNDYIFSRICEANNNNLDIVVGGRTYKDLEYWKEKNYLIVGIKAEIDIRRQRIVNRDKENIADNNAFKHTTERDAAEIVEKFCDIAINNSGTLDDLRIEAEKLIEIYNSYKIK